MSACKEQNQQTSALSLYVFGSNYKIYKNIQKNVALSSFSFFNYDKLQTLDPNVQASVTSNAHIIDLAQMKTQFQINWTQRTSIPTKSYQYILQIHSSCPVFTIPPTSQFCSSICNANQSCLYLIFNRLDSRQMSISCIAQRQDAQLH